MDHTVNIVLAVVFIVLGLLFLGFALYNVLTDRWWYKHTLPALHDGKILYLLLSVIEKERPKWDTLSHEEQGTYHSIAYLVAMHSTNFTLLDEAWLEKLLSTKETVQKNTLQDMLPPTTT